MSKQKAKPKSPRKPRPQPEPRYEILAEGNPPRPVKNRYTDDNDNWFGPMWDMQAGHLTMGMSTTPEGTPMHFNDQCKDFQGENFDDISRYSLASGMNEILR